LLFFLFNLAVLYVCTTFVVNKRIHKNLDRSFFRFVTIHAFDRQINGRTDRRTALSSLYRVCIPCSAVKAITFYSSYSSISECQE